MMLKYELKKIFARTGSKVAVLILLAALGITCYFAVDVSYVNEAGVTEHGLEAAAKLRQAQKEWAGVLDEEKLRRVIEENRRINETPEAQSKDYRQNNIAFGRKQGISDIRSLLNNSYAEEFRSYDYYRADRLQPEEAASFYTNRTTLLEKWLRGEAKEQFSEPEKEYLLSKYESLETPFYYDYMRGWIQLFEYSPTVIMIMTMILGYLTTGIFSNEYQWKADAIFFSSVYGRNKAVAAKLKAGFCIVTLLYWLVILVYSGVVLWYLGMDGAGCPVQADWSGWKCFYQIQIWQEYLLIVCGGYIGCLFISFLVMLVSAKTRSAVLAVMAPFVLIFVPSFLSNINSPVINKVLGLLPDRLLQVGKALAYFDLYELGGRVVGAVPVLLLFYSVLALVIVPVIYRGYRKGA